MTSFHVIMIKIILTTTITLLSCHPNLTSAKYVSENYPQESVQIDYLKSSETFQTSMDVEQSGKFSFSIALISFVCPLAQEDDDPPYLSIYTRRNGPEVAQFPCKNKKQNNNWEALESVRGSIWFNITASPGWKVDWSAKIVGTLYQNEYATNGQCAPGYFDCDAPNEKCDGKNLGRNFSELQKIHETAGTARCILNKLVCDKTPSCAMLCNPDEVDCKGGGGDDDDDDDFGISIWVYIGPAIGVVAIVVIILLCRYSRTCGVTHTPSRMKPTPHAQQPQSQPQEPSAPAAELDRQIIGAVVIPIVSGRMDTTNRNPAYPPSYEESIAQ
ncbi:uncharacterized protein LOC110852613 [Folsomia candida]|uniref:uncharacterized protein LOC110852613 n=1 Tax=Folsomia candida TaxID=158441 RepID=UPI000B8F1491|nr:uncharacterized protein LOC110852613 [Folsomia candida]